MQNKRKTTWLIIMMTVVVLLAGVVSLPPVWSRVTYHSHLAYTAAKYWLYPPNEVVFVPSTLADGRMVSSVAAATAVSGPITEPTLTPSQPTPKPTIPPIPTLNSLPPLVLLEGIKKERQFMNNCGPTTLSMYLSYYGWGKDQIAAAKVLRPNAKDVNVMPYEVVDFVNEHTAQHALWRYGGDLQTIKTLLHAGFPVMIEKSFQPYSLRKEGWMGHYNLVVGYDDKKQILTVEDSYLMSYAPWGGEIPVDQWDSFIGFDFSYSELEQDWRSFNFVFIVVYPPEKENDVLRALGPLATEEWAYRHAYDRAMQETTSLTDVRDQFFAWFNAGTSLVYMKNYDTAVTAFDTAFGIYPDIKDVYRPYRMLWYQTGPYEAYYGSGRYQDVITLADQTLGYMSEPALEESYYWRALSYVALGDTTRAIVNLRTSLEYHPGFAPSVALLKQLGKTP